MKSLKFHITTLSPLLITSNTGDPNMVSTKQYISGTVILGALAGMYIRKNNPANAHERPDFYNWFLNGSLKFTNAYIVSYDDKNNIKNYIPLPLSIQKNKDDENDIHDLLFSGDEEIADKTTKIIGGFGNVVKDSLYEQGIKKSLNFHHERDPEKGTTKEGMIFNYESIDAGQIFEGAIVGEKNDLSDLCKFFGESFETNIGRSRSAQYGKISFKFLNNTPEDLPVNSTTGEVALTLLSDTIIYNEQGFSTTDKEDFEKVLQAKIGQSVKIEKAFIKTGEVENFVSVWKLRKPSETCFLMGSCFLISGANDAEKLKELQINGIGERTHEGFGRVVIEMQTKTNKTLKKRDYSEATISSGTLPTLAKEIAKVAAKNYIRRTFDLKALTECADFEQLPTKSLVSRLEMAVRSRNYAQFIEYLDGLRDTAKDKLQKCNNGKDTLLEFLQKKEVKIDGNIMRDNIQKFCDEIKYVPAEDIDFMNSLYKSYFETFFSAMRKAKKMEKEGQND